jgi:tripartite-type tricarboxylate transporter receptor subunit TctC
MPFPFSPVRRLLLCATALLCAGVACAQSGYPSQSIKLIVPFPPAGGTDVVSRLMADAVTQATHWNIVIDNRPGAGGNIGIDAVAKARPDGLTIGMAQTSNLAINPTLYRKMPFDALKDFAPVMLVGSQPVVLVVRADSPIHTLADLKARAKARPLNMASAGNGTVSHLAGAMFAHQAGVELTHVAYKGAGPAITDLLAGQTDLYFGTPPSVLPMIKAGKLRAVAVTSAQRMPLLPAVPTVAESGYPGYVAEDWKALVAPAGTPADVVQTLNKAFNAALARPATLARLREEGTTPRGGTPAELADLMNSEHQRWGAAVKASGATVE